MKNQTAYLLLLFLIRPFLFLSAQEPESHTPVRFVNFSSQNDFYQYHFHSDRNFTNGIQIQTSFPDYDRIFTKKSLIGKMAKGNQNFILAIGQEMYTPSNINTIEVDSSDRPYAGTLFIKMSRTISNKETKFQIQSNIHLGVIGTASGAMETQNFIHRLINNEEAMGWHNQIGNGLILDYGLKIRKGIRNLPENIDLSGTADLHLGTINNFVSLGGRLRFGLFNNPYADLGIYNPSNESRNRSEGKKFQIYLDLEANGGYLFYDGTVSGSLIPFKASPYIIPPQDVPRWTYSLSYGVTLSWKTFQFNYLNLFTNPFYSHDKFAGWGQVEVIISF